MPGADLHDPFQDRLLGLLAESLQTADAALARRFFQLVQRRDVELADQRRRLARPQPRNLHQIERTVGKLAPQLLQVLELSGLHQLGDFLVDGLSHPGKLSQRPPLDALVEPAGRGRVRRQRLERIRRHVVGAHLEGVLALQLQKL